MAPTQDRPKLGVSSCLLGHAVRYDAGHKLNETVAETLAAQFDLVPFCPEVAIGLGTPRPPILLSQQHGRIHAIGVNDPGQDVTTALETYAPSVALRLEDFCGYIVKSDSPSCGMRDVAVNHNKTNGVGVYTARLMALCPILPFEDEGRLAKPKLRENFVTRVLILYRWRHMALLGLNHRRLVEFNTEITTQQGESFEDLAELLAQDGDLPGVAKNYLVHLMQRLR